MKSEKGITMLMLVIMIIVLVILVYTGITVGSNSIAEVKLQNFTYELQQIQGRVDSIHEKMTMTEDNKFVRLDGREIGRNITVSDDAVKLLKEMTSGVIDYDNITNQTKESHYPETGISKYRYLSKQDLKTFLDIKNAKLNVIVNFETREVICVEGFNYYGTIYHTRADVSEAK